MILLAVFQAFCRFFLFFVKILFTAGLAFVGVLLLLALFCALAGEDDE